MIKSSFIAGVSALALTAIAAPVSAMPMAFSATGTTAADIQTAVDDFRNALGALNPFTPVNNVGGRRQINWDAAPDAVSDPNSFAGDFFNFTSAPRARGIEFSGGTNPDGTLAANAATGFLLSSTAASGQAIEFGQPNQFSTFSAERLFAPTGGTLLDVDFFDPADTSAQATTRGFGAVFTDVEVMGSTSMAFFDIDGNLLAMEMIDPAGNAGLSFFGLVFDDPDIAKVQILAGGIPIDQFGNSTGMDLVVMDDFIFGEPTPLRVPEPLSALLFAPFAALGLARGRGKTSRKN